MNINSIKKSQQESAEIPKTTEPQDIRPNRSSINNYA